MGCHCPSGSRAHVDLREYFSEPAQGIWASTVPLQQVCTRAEYLPVWSIKALGDQHLLPSRRNQTWMTHPHDSYPDHDWIDWMIMHSKEHNNRSWPSHCIRSLREASALWWLPLSTGPGAHPIDLGSIGRERRLRTAPFVRRIQAAGGEIRCSRARGGHTDRQASGQLGISCCHQWSIRLRGWVRSWFPVGRACCETQICLAPSQLRTFFGLCKERGRGTWTPFCTICDWAVATTSFIRTFDLRASNAKCRIGYAFATPRGLFQAPMTAEEICQRIKSLPDSALPHFVYRSISLEGFCKWHSPWVPGLLSGKEQCTR